MNCLYFLLDMEGKTVDYTSTSPTTNSSLSVPASSLHIPVPAPGGTAPCSNYSIRATTSREGVDCQEVLPRLRSRMRTIASKRGVGNEVRHKRRKSHPGESGCPVCGLTLRPGEMDTHFNHELDKLTRLPQSRPLAQRTPTPTPSSSTEGATTSTPLARTRHGTGEPGYGAGWEAYQRVKKNREVRVRVKRRRLAGGEGEVTCPVCSKRLPINPTSSSSCSRDDEDDDIHTHIDQCLRRAEDEVVELEDEVDVEYEEYTWCGQTRVRATQMLRAEGQLHALGTKVERGSEDELVEVCDDEDHNKYGPSQYTDGDLPPQDVHTDGDVPPHDVHTDADVPPQDVHTDGDVPPQDVHTDGDVAPHDVHTDGDVPPHDVHTDEDVPPHDVHTDQDLPDSLETNGDLPANDLHTNQCLHNHVNNLAEESPSCDGLGVVVCEAASSSSSHRDGLYQASSNTGSEEGGSSGTVVEALRARVLELEQTTTRGRYTCRVCHGEYETPLVSVVCWHVHCEQCWLPALAAKKLCPQCSAITVPPDLRRVYL